MKKPTIEIDGKKYRLTVQKMNGQRADEDVTYQISDMPEKVRELRSMLDHWDNMYHSKNKELIQFKQQAIRSAEHHVAEVAALKQAIANAEAAKVKRITRLTSWLVFFGTIAVTVTALLIHFITTK